MYIDPKTNDIWQNEEEYRYYISMHSKYSEKARQGIKKYWDRKKNGYKGKRDES